MKRNTTSFATALALLAAAALAQRDDEIVATNVVPRGLPSALGVNAPAPDIVELGRALFFDPLLSVTRDISCSSCHRPDHGFASPDALSLGVHGQRTLRNAPTLYNRALGTSFMWDGSASTLEEQVLQPIVNEREMGMTLGAAVERLREERDYAARFEATFARAPGEETLAEALSAYIRTLLYADSPLDHFRDGAHAALTPAERGGMWFFESRGGCWRCHSGPNFTDEDFHNTGVGVVDGEPREGRFAVTGSEDDRGRFKTPTLRGLVETAPYMHDGSLATLEDVVAFYRQGGHANANLDDAIVPLEMTDADARNLAAFLRALSRRAEPAAVEAGSVK